MWQWYHLRAQEMITERLAEADEYRLARAANSRRRTAPPRRPLESGIQRALQAGR